MSELRTRKELHERLCAIVGLIQNDVFEFSLATDCFCGENNCTADHQSYRFDTKVLDFIEDAVKAKIADCKVQI